MYSVKLYGNLKEKCINILLQCDFVDGVDRMVDSESFCGLLALHFALVSIPTTSNGMHVQLSVCKLLNCLCKIFGVNDTGIQRIICYT